jgi:hypothetical protein
MQPPPSALPRRAPGCRRDGPRNGGSPRWSNFDYDNNDLLPDSFTRAALNNDPYTLLLNHAVVGQYPPG